MSWLRARPHELSVPRAHPAAQGEQGGLAPRQRPDQGAGGPLPELPPPRAAPGQAGPQAPVPMPVPRVDASPFAGGGSGPGDSGSGGGPYPGGGPGAPDGGAGSGYGPGGAGVSGPGVVVDVEGKVAHPGVRTLPNGARVIDAITAAGGALPGTDLSTLNQAQVLVDGQQILVGIAPPPNAGPTPPGRSGGKHPRGGTLTPVRLNSATLADLEQLPGVGPALAQRILDYRGEHGPFRSVADLQQVSGFGGARFQNIEPLLTL